MPFFSKTSRDRLATCEQDLQIVFNAVIRLYDCTIVEGERSEERQKELVKTGKSKTMKSKHLFRPSKAVDAVPWPFDYDKLNKGDKDTWNQFYHFVGFVMGVASGLGIKLRSGADWNQNYDIKDETFRDLFHFELITEDSQPDYL